MMKLTIVALVAALLLGSAMCIPVRLVKRMTFANASYTTIATTNSKNFTGMFFGGSDSVIYIGDNGTKTILYGLNVEALAVHPYQRKIVVAYKVAPTGNDVIKYTINGAVPVSVTRVSTFNVANNDSMTGMNEVIHLTLPNWVNSSSATAVGDIGFDKDGYLYIGATNTYPVQNGKKDNEGRGRDRVVLANKILRIDINTQGVDTNRVGYDIPSSNPLAGTTGILGQEMYAKGLGNAGNFLWKDGSFYATDAVEGTIELNKIESNKDYGFSVRLGNDCYVTPNCTSTGLTSPLNTIASNATAIGLVFWANKYILATDAEIQWYNDAFISQGRIELQSDQGYNVREVFTGLTFSDIHQDARNSSRIFLLGSDSTNQDALFEFVNEESASSAAKMILSVVVAVVAAFAVLL